MVDFDEFVEATGPRLRAALVSAYGSDVGAEATADALAYAWQHWDRIRAMTNPSGYLYRVGQTSARRSRKVLGAFPATEEEPTSDFEPRLMPALAALSEHQRVVVVMTKGYGWPLIAVAEVLDISVSSVRTHLDRALSRLQSLLEVDRVD